MNLWKLCSQVLQVGLDPRLQGNLLRVMKKVLEDFLTLQNSFLEQSRRPEERPRQQRAMQPLPSQMQFNRYSNSSAMEMNLSEPVEDFKFPEETRGQNIYHNEFSEVNHEDFMPCERNAKVFHCYE